MKSSASIDKDDIVEEYEYDSSELIGGDEVEGESKLSVNVEIENVKSFLYKAVDTTDIAELDLQVGDLELYVKRKVDTVAAAPPPAPVAAPAAAPVEIELEEAEDSVDESAVYLTSEVVGIFRRGRYVKGKKIGTNAMVEVGDTVKKGQTVGFVEQMGTYTPVLANQAGEVSKLEVEEGSPIGYGQTLLAILPFFGGHIIGESKHV